MLIDSGVVGDDGKWSFVFPDTLVLVDGETIIAVALNDEVIDHRDELTESDFNKLTNNGVFRNGGNENPSGDYDFHDATFSGRLELGVVYYGTLALTVSSEISYGNDSNKITPGVATYPAGAMELEVEDSRVFRVEWELTARLEQPFTKDGGSDVLDIDLIYVYDNTETVIGTSEVSIWNHTNTSDDFSIYDQWDIAGNGDGLFVKASAGNVKTGSYTAKIEWVLSDTP